MLFLGLNRGCPFQNPRFYTTIPRLPRRFAHQKNRSVPREPAESAGFAPFWERNAAAVKHAWAAHFPPPVPFEGAVKN